jgi:hypothetical protein
MIGIGSHPRSASNNTDGRPSREPMRRQTISPDIREREVSGVRLAVQRVRIQPLFGLEEPAGPSDRTACNSGSYGIEAAISALGCEPGGVSS